MLVGGYRSLLAMLAVPLLDKFKSTMLLVPSLCIWWLVSSVLWQWPSPIQRSNFLPQLIGVVAVGVFVFSISSVLWFAMKKTIGIRVTEEEEYVGLDQAELGVAAYPEFVS